MKVLVTNHHVRSRRGAVAALTGQKYFPVDADVAVAAIDGLFDGVPGYLVSGAQAAGKDVVAGRVADSIDHPFVQIRMSEQIRAEAAVLLDIVRAYPDTRDVAVKEAAAQLDLTDWHAEFCVNAIRERAIGDADYTPWTRDEPMRVLLQYLGHEARIDTHPGYWTEACYRQVAQQVAAGVGVYLADGRFPTEVLHGRNVGLFTVRLHADEDVRIARIKQRDGFVPSLDTLRHAGEVILDQGNNWELFDKVLDNSGPESDIDLVVEEIVASIEAHQGLLSAS